jgi:hypothetical protein
LSHSKGASSSPPSLPQPTHKGGGLTSSGCRGISENFSFGLARRTVVFCAAAMLLRTNFNTDPYMHSIYKAILTQICEFQSKERSLLVCWHFYVPQDPAQVLLRYPQLVGFNKGVRRQTIVSSLTPADGHGGAVIVRGYQPVGYPARSSKNDFASPKTHVSN